MTNSLLKKTIQEIILEINNYFAQSTNKAILPVVEPVSIAW